MGERPRAAWETGAVGKRWGSAPPFQCDTSTNGSRPRRRCGRFARWRNRLADAKGMWTPWRRLFYYNMRYGSLTEMRMREIGVGLALCGALLTGCGTPSGPPVRVIIPHRASFRAAAESLAHAGMVQSAFAFRVYAR